MRKLWSLLIMIIIFIFLFIPALAGSYTDFATAWKVLENDGVLEYASMGSPTFVDRLQYVMKTKSTTKIGGDYYNYNKHASSCWGFGQDAGGYLAGIQAPTSTSGRTKGVLNGSAAFKYDDFIRVGVPQRGCTIVRTGTSETIKTFGDNKGHTMVLLYYNQSYVYYLDGNNASGRKQALWKMTWSEWTKKELKDKGRYIKYLVWNSEAAFLKKYPDAGLKSYSNDYWKTATKDIQTWASTSANTSAGTIKKGDAIVVNAYYEDKKSGVFWYRTLNNQYIKKSDVGEIASFNSYKAQGKGTTLAQLTTTVRPVKSTTALYSEPYAASIQMKTITSNDAMTVKAIIKNNVNHYWLLVSYDNSEYYICANMVKESFVGPRKDVWIEGSWVAGVDYPAGNYPENEATGIGLHGTIKSAFPIKCVNGGWYYDYLVGIPVLDSATSSIFYKTEPSSGAFPNYNTKSVDIKSSNINTLDGKRIKKLGKNTYYYRLNVVYWIWKDVVSDSELPLQEKTWYSDKMFFTVGGGSQNDTPVVSSIAVTGVSLDKNLATIKIDGSTYGSCSLTATVSPSNATDKSITWTSSNNNVATINNGKVTAVAPGTATITATAADGSGKKAACTVTVQKMVSNVSLSSSDVILYKNGTNTIQLSATIQPTDASNKNVTWSSSDNNVVTVDQNGNVTAKGIGNATISAKANDGSGRQATCNITVRAWVDTLSVTGINSVNKGYTTRLAASIAPENAYDKHITWMTSDENTATVNSDGYVEGINTGTVTITAIATDRNVVIASFDMTVTQPVTDIVLTGDRDITVGDKVTINATVLPFNADNQDIIWISSDTSIATVSEDGTVTAIADGSATITAIADDGSGVTAKYVINVHPLVSDIIVDGADVIAAGGTVKLIATVEPSNVLNSNVIWTVDHPDIARIDEDGNVAGLKPGSVTVTVSATDNSGVSSDYNIQIVKQKLAVNINGGTLVHTGSNIRLNAEITSDEPVSDNTVTWSSSDPSVATVDQNGAVTGINNGTCVIIATSNMESYYYARHPIVVDTLVSDITLNGITDVDARASVQLTATILPKTATNKAIIWSSADESIAVVDGNGLVSAIKAGEVTITAKAQDGSEITGSIKVTVYPLPEMITVSGETEMLTGRTYQLNAEVLPKNTRNKNVVWSSNDPEVVTINENGLATPVSNGSVVITATADGNTETFAEYYVNVTTQAASIELSAPMRIDVGEMGTVTATVLPETTSNKQLIWTSSDDEIASVDVNGNVYAKTGGYVTIAAETTDGSGIIAEVEIQSFQYVRDISADVEPIAYTGQEFWLSALILPEDASETDVVWTSGNENVIAIEERIVDTEGGFYAVCINPGIAKLTATALDGSGVSGYAYVQVLPYTQLNRNTATYTVYTNGDDRSTLGRISLTSDCAERVAEDRNGAVWTIEHVSGDYAAAIGVNERTNNFAGFTLANSVDLKLLGINRTGSDTYRITCSVNGQTDSCTVTVNVENPPVPLPENISLPITTFSAMVGEQIDMDVTPVASPAGTALPDDANPFLYGVDSFNRYAQVNMGEDVFSVTFSKAGVYSAYVRYAGTNYQYDAYATFVITTPAGTIPPEVEALSITNSTIYLLPGETLACEVDISPAAADEATLIWSSSNPEVVTVSTDGTLNAISSGMSVITVSAENGVSTSGLVIVTESLLSIDWNSNDVIEVYLDGETKSVIQNVYLTARASAQLTESPEWSLKRQSGNNLTLLCEPITATNENGELLYGCSIILKSVSDIGTTDYELVCDDGTYSSSTTIHVNANRVEDVLPSIVQWQNAVLTGTVNERLTVYPIIQCWPAGTALPDEVTISFVGDQYWNSTLKTNDFTVSRSMITLAFNEPGIYTANCVYSCSNMRYLVPVTVRVADSNGNVPIRLMKVILDENEISLKAGDTKQLHAALSPADATNRTVIWTSDNPAIATVDENGLVTGISNGRANITCTPSDMNCLPVRCTVIVEDEFTVTKYQEMDFQYLQGETGNAVAGFRLSDGTAKRVEAEGLKPVWTLSRLNGDSAQVELREYNGIQYIVVTELLKGGTDTYQVVCRAGDHSWTGQASLEVCDLGITAPGSVKIAKATYTATVGEAIELDFTPVCEPAGTSVPTELQAEYIGIGDIYNAIDDPYRFTLFTAGDQFELAFKKPGTYLLSRQYSSCNLTYITECRIEVGEGQLNLIKCTDEDAMVYIGGKSAIASTCIIRDTSIEELYGSELIWNAERLSGDCMTVALRADQSSASLYVVNAREEGEEVWRVSCTFRGITDYADITIRAVQSRAELPESVTLYQTEFSDMIGNTIAIPLAVECSPDGSALPATENEAWSFSTDGNTKAHATWSFADGQMKIVFSESGYYGGELVYQSGNVTYRFPISFAITDEEYIQAEPEHLAVAISDDAITIYPEGEIGIGIANAVLTDSLDEYSLSSVAAYAERNNAVWSIQILSGNACELSIRSVSASSVQIVPDTISGSGDVAYEIKCTVGKKSASAQGTVHVASDGEERPQPELRQNYYATPTGTVLSIDASMYNHTHTVKLASGKDSIWDNKSALAAMGYEYETTDDLLIPVFYEPGSYITTITNRIGNMTFSKELVIAAYTSRTLPASPSRLTFPTALNKIEAEAFETVDVNIVDMRGTQVAIIGEHAFANNDQLMRVYLPGSVTSISSNAFDGCEDFVIYCEEGSYADTWAQSMKYPVVYGIE